MQSQKVLRTCDETRRSAESFACILACAGLLNALIAAVLLCRLPQSGAPSVFGLLVRAALYVSVAAIAGAAGSWLYWSPSSHPSKLNFPVSMVRFDLACIEGWVWVPAVVLLVAEPSPAAAVVAAIGAGMLGMSLREVIPSTLPLQSPSSSERELFAQILQTQTFRSHGYVIAILFYTGGFALHDHSISMASALMAFSAFLFGWESASGESPARQTDAWRVAKRLGWVVPLAILVTVWALLDGVAHRARMEAADVALASENSREEAAKSAAKKANSTSGYGGYESIILWPPRLKKQITPPLPLRTELLAPGTSEPLVIRFDGAYWYFQPPETKPGPTAHQALGTPLSAHIRSNNSFPLSMEAHQNLGSAIRLSRCREIEVEIENRESEATAVALAVLLADSTAPGKPKLYLGQQVLKTTLPDHFAVLGSPNVETLRFEIPSPAKIRKFDEITVMLLPDAGPALVGPKIAVRQFQLFPR